MMNIRLLLADDHEVVLESLAMMISSMEGMSVVATSTNGQDALDQLGGVPVDIMLSDMHMPKLNGIELALRIKEYYPHVKLILLTMEEEPETIRTAMQVGVWGYVLKKASRREVQQAILSVASGKKYFTEMVNHQLSRLANDCTTHGKEIPEAVALLSKREIEVIRLIATEVPGQAIAEQLFISPSTVETHRRNIFRKLDIHTVVALTRFAIKHKII